MTVLDFNTARTLSQLEAEQRSRASSKVDAEHVRREVAARSREFVEWLFPHAAIHRNGRVAAVGDVYGTPGDSLSIELAGSKNGYWHDWNSDGDQGKDLIGLFMASMDLDRVSGFPQAIRTIAREFLGLAVSEPTETTFRARIETRSREQAGKPIPNISDRPPPTEKYTYRGRDGMPVGVIRRHEFDEVDPATGKPKKTFSVWDPRTHKAQAPSPRPVYRIPEILQASEVVFVEGERKADALAALGIEATCIMFGSKAPLDKVDWSPIAGKSVTIWPDNDASGIEFGRRVASILAALGCSVRIVSPPADKPPKWDAADCVAEGGEPHRIIEQAAGWGFAQPDQAPRYRLYTLEELEDLPPPRWIIDGILVEGGLSLLWAGSDSFKTFVVIDFAMCVACGIPWHGREVTQGPVVYVAAEDDMGVKLRMVGWRETRGKGYPRPDVRIFRDGITLVSEDSSHLLAAIAGLPEQPRLIVIDTLARTFGAGNENQTADMNAYVLAADRLRAATGANVLVIHHTGVNTERERGNMALRGACNTIITIKRNGEKIKLINAPPKGKQKNAEPFQDISLRMQKVSFTLKDVEYSTLVVMPDDPCTPADGDPLEDDEPTETEMAPHLGSIERSIVAVIEEVAQSGRYLGFNTLQASVAARREGGCDKGSFGRAVRKLLDKGLIRQNHDTTYSLKVSKKGNH